MESELRTRTSMEMRRWLAVGIFLHTVLIPLIRDIIRKTMPAFYERLTRRNKIDVQTSQKHLKRLERNGVTLNYESINDNHKIKHADPSFRSNYIYEVRDPVSLAKLLVETHMAKFKDFDETCETSATLAIFVGVPEFNKHARNLAKGVNSLVRRPWAHPILRAWTQEKYEGCFRVMKLLVEALFRDKNKEEILDKLEFWKTQGPDNCLGKLLDDVIVRSLRNEVEAVEEKMTKYEQTTGAEIKKIRQALNSFRDEVCIDFKKLQTDLANRKNDLHEMERRIKEFIRLEVQGLHERVDRMEVKLTEALRTSSDKQLDEEIFLDARNMRQFVERKHLQPNMEQAYGLPDDQPQSVDDLDYNEKANINPKKSKKRRGQKR